MVRNRSGASSLRLGFSFLKNQKHTESLDRFRAAISENPDLFSDVIIGLYQKSMHTSEKSAALALITAELLIESPIPIWALDELTDAYEIEPKNARLYYLLVKLYQKIGLHPDIRSILESAFDRDILDETIIEIVPMLYMDDNDLDRSVRCYEKLIERHPDHIHYYTTLAEILIKKNELSAASSLYRTIISLFPDYKHTAIQRCEALIKHNPDHIELRKNLATIYLTTCQIEAAITHFDMIANAAPDEIPSIVLQYKAALSSYPSCPDIHLAIGRLLIVRNQLSEAVDALSIVDSFGTYDNSVNAALTTIIERSPYHPTARFLRLSGWIRHQKYDDALTDCEALIDGPEPEFDAINQFLQQIPRTSVTIDAHVRRILAKIHIIKSEFSEALAILSPILDGPEPTKTKRILAEISTKNLEFRQALAYYHEILIEDFDDATVHTLTKVAANRVLKDRQDLLGTQLSRTSEKSQFKHGLLLMRNGNLFDAIGIFQQISDESHLISLATMMIGIGFAELGKYSLAIRQFTNIDNPMIDSGSIQLWQGFVEIQAGNYANACEIFGRLGNSNGHFPAHSEWLKYYENFKHSAFGTKAVLPVLTGLSEKPSRLIAFPLKSKKNIQAEPITMATSQVSHAIELLLSENLALASENLSIAQQLEPKLPSLNFHWGSLALMRGEFDKAIIWFSAFIQNDIYPELGHAGIATGHLLKHDFENARIAIHNALDVSPNHPTIHLIAGDIAMQLSNPVSAYQHWEIAADCLHLRQLVSRRTAYLNADSKTASDWIHMLTQPIFPPYYDYRNG